MENITQSMVDHWRNHADAGNPAGPLFASGEFAEADIAGSDTEITVRALCPTNCEDCTGSVTINCR